MRRKFLFSTLVTSFLTLTAFSGETSGYRIVEDKAQLPLLNPSLSDRKVAKIKLDNGLQVYLISDPGTDQSAAALSVEAGSWNDPKEYPGMAHFLEHMLFMGTAAYPKEFEYMQYITDNGGSVNAFTAPDRTVYMFSVNNEGFQGALDRFSHFFIDPLFTPSCIGRELHAVDQEHAKNIENDNWREYMIFKETGNPLHPNSGFSTGNAKTLSGIPQDVLKEWYRNHYSAEKMHLVVMSPLSIDTLTNLVLQDFSKVPTRQVACCDITGDMVSANQMGHLIAIKPIKDLRRLSLVWEVPKEFALDNEKKAPQLVAYLLMSDSDKSLLQVLKKEKIAEDLSVIADRFGKNEMLLRIDISLTQQGLSQIDAAISHCFEAIARLKETGIPKKYFDELRTLAMLNYQYQSRQDAFTVVRQHADDMIDEALETYPLKTSIPTTYDPQFISAFVNSLTPKHCIFFLTADPRLTGLKPDSTEKWMSAEYGIKEIPEETLTAWTKMKPSDEITLPPSNPYIPGGLALVENAPQAAPVLIADDEHAKVYFASDAKYRVPESCTYFNVKSPLINGSPKSAALTDLYIIALSEKLSSSLFFAKAAGINTSFSQDLKLEIGVGGYSEKAPLLIKEIFRALKTTQPSADQFEIYKQTLSSRYENADKELPVFQAKETLANILFNDSPTNHEKHKVLKTVTYEEFLAFSQNLFQKAYVEGLFYGNLVQSDTETLWNDLKTTLNAQAYPPSQHVKKKVLLLPDNPYMIVQNTERQGNAVMLLLEQGAFTFDKRASQQVLSKALQDGFFDTLRTKQQTGYFAKAWDSEVERQLLQFFAVQSSTHHPSDLIARFELFLEDFVKNFPERISAERFENIRKMLITTLQMPPENLQGMGDRLNTLAFTYEGDFSWFDKRIQSLEALTYQEVSKDASLFLSRANPRRLAILVEGVLTADNDFHYEQISKEELKDLGTFVSWK